LKININKFIELINKRNKKYSIIMWLFGIIAMIIVFPHARDARMNLEKNIQHGFEIRPLVMEKLADYFPITEITSDDLIFRTTSSTRGTKRDSMGYLRRWGRYLYILNGNESNRFLVHWEEDENGGIIITSIEVY
jgi:hypothetical protein